MSSIVVFIEHSAGTARRASLECLGAAQATGANVIAVLGGPGAAEVASGLGTNGAGKVVCLTGRDAYSPDAMAKDVASVVQSESANGFFAAASSNGKDLAARVAAHLDSVLFSDCIGIESAGGGFKVVRPWLAGKLLATLESSAPVFCATTRPNVFPVFEGGGSADVTETAASADAKSEVTAVSAKEVGKLDVKEAPIVISGGRGLKEAEHFKMLEDLAAAFGNAAVGASRAVVDLGWRPHAEQVGQTGKTVAPKLYVAVGISGAIQHLAGMKTSQVIVAINKDPEAPIFKVADFGIVGDAFEVVPALTEAIKGILAEV